MRAKFIAAAGIALALATGTAALAETTIPGKFVVARTDGSGLIIWDCAPVIEQIVKDKLSDSDANVLLQRDALLVLAKTASQFAASKDVRVRVVYSKTGAINPAYGAATFTGIERYAELVMPVAKLRGDTEHWKEAAAGTGALPAFTALAVKGTLPPR